VCITLSLHFNLLIIGNDYKMMCNFCGGKHLRSEFLALDDVRAVHRTRYPYCKFSRGKFTYNIPMKTFTELFGLVKSPSIDQYQEPTDLDLNIITVHCRNIRLRNLKKRADQSATALLGEGSAAQKFRLLWFANAGFYKPHPSVNFTCFWCGGRLMTERWRSIRDPWQEHAKYVLSGIITKISHFVRFLEWQIKILSQLLSNFLDGFLDVGT